MTNQPTPSVTRDDVARVIRRDFQGHDETTILAILDKYGVEEWERERDRVHLAVLKLSDRNLKELSKYIEIACDDYRDVLGAAEYPEDMKHGVGPYVRGERTRIYASDWNQYEQWLFRK